MILMTRSAGERNFIDKAVYRTVGERKRTKR
jgi:hypothetical protein